MKKTISIIHSLYIVFASVMGCYGIYNETFKAAFKTENWWTLNIWITIILTGISVVVIVTQFLNPYVCGFFQKVWWLAQLIYVQEWTQSSIGSTKIVHRIYEPTMFVEFGLGFGMGDKADLTYIGINVIALAGLIIAIRNHK